MTSIKTVMYSGKTHTKASSPGVEIHSPNGRLNIHTSALVSGAGQDHVFAAALPHPTAEQLFAGAWSACYISAISVTAKTLKLTLPSDLAVEVEVDLGMAGDAYLLQARFNNILPGMDKEDALRLSHAAHEVCPYSKAVHGNIDVDVRVTVERDQEAVGETHAA